eukprot:4641933-Amphidinium_carterae.1
MLLTLATTLLRSATQSLHQLDSYKLTQSLFEEIIIPVSASQSLKSCSAEGCKIDWSSNEILALRVNANSLTPRSLKTAARAC